MPCLYVYTASVHYMCLNCWKIDNTLYLIISTVLLSLDYPNTWCPHLIRMAEIFGYHNAHGTIHIPAHARVEVTMSMSIIKNAVSTIRIIEGSDDRGSDNRGSTI